jgi:hypothetical protein
MGAGQGSGADFAGRDYRPALSRTFFFPRRLSVYNRWTQQ